MILFLLTLISIVGIVSTIGITFLIILRYGREEVVCEVCGASDGVFVGKWGSTRVICEGCYKRETEKTPQHL